jgi:hypothetical protein
MASGGIVLLLAMIMSATVGTALAHQKEGKTEGLCNWPYHTNDRMINLT